MTWPDWDNLERAEAAELGAISLRPPSMNRFVFASIVLAVIGGLIGLWMLAK